MHWHRGLNPFWPHMFGLKPLLGLEPMAPIRPQLLVSHANRDIHMYVCMYVCMRVYLYVCMCVCVCVCVLCGNIFFNTTQCVCVCYKNIYLNKESNVLFNDTSNTFYLQC